jgi:hypothetical protein
MTGTAIRTMLRAEMKTSEEFSRRNFGLAIGDDFREMVEEVIKDTGVDARLLCGTLMASLGGKRFAESLKDETQKNLNDDSSLQRAILANLETFKPPMEFLYWGIQIGRKLAKEENEALKKLEQDGLKA